MGRRCLKLQPERADYLPPPGSKRRPLTAVIVGGKPEYGNVRKLPDLLWKEFGIAVVAHENGKNRRDEVKPLYDLAIGLVDLAGHGILEWGKTAAEQTVYVPSSWSSLHMALLDVGVEPFDGETFLPPPEPEVQDLTDLKGTAPLPVPPPPADLLPEPAEQEAPVAAAAEQKNSPTLLPSEVKKLIIQLKGAMSKNDIERLELQLHDGELAVEFRRVVVQEGIEVL